MFTLASQSSRWAQSFLLGVVLCAVGPDARAQTTRPSDDEAAATDESDEPEDPALSEEPDAEEEPLVETENAPAEGQVKLSSEAADRAVRAEIDKGKFGFCSDPRYRLNKSDQRLCQLADAASVRCPEFRAACQRVDHAAEPSRELPTRKRSPESAQGRSLGAMSDIARIVFWSLLLFGVVFLIVAVVRNLMKGESTPKAPPAEDAGDAPTEKPELRLPVETDAERLLARARALAAQGNYAQALGDAYAALLRHLDQRGLIELHNSRTNGDYVRALREHRELQLTLRGAARDLERVQFGTSPPTAELFESLVSRVVPVVARGAIALFTIGLLLSNAACGSFDDDAGGGQLGAWSRSPRGLALLRELALAQGTVLRNRVRGLEQIEPEVDAIILLDTMLEPVERASVWSFVERGGLLVVAANTGELERRVGARPTYGDCKGELVLEPSYRDKVLFGRSIALRTTPNRALAVSNAEHWVVARCREEPYILAGERGDGTLLVLPNSDLLSNASLVTADNAFFVLGLLGDARTIDVVGHWTGAGSTTPFAAISNTKLTPLLGQLLLLLIVVCVWRGARFGAPRDPPERSRRAFEEHVRALGLVYARARATRLALGNYSAWALERLRERLEPSMDPSLHGLAAAIAARTGRAEGAIMRLLVEARSARDDPARDTSTPDDLQTMRDLDRLIAELKLSRAAPR